MVWLWAAHGAKALPFGEKKICGILTQKESPELLQGHCRAGGAGGGPLTPTDQFPLLRINCPLYGSGIFALQSDALPLITTTAMLGMSRRGLEQSLGV